MTPVRALLKDRRRAQRGSVLGGVLIITAFIAMLAGALMTEVSTNFLLSRALMHRVDDQATVDSAVALGTANLQAAPIPGGCPSLPAASLNGLTAAATYIQCGPEPDAHDSPQFRSLTGNVGFSNDGTMATVQGRSEFLVAADNGTLWGFEAGKAPWSVVLGTETTGRPAVMPDGSTILVPIKEVSGSSACDNGCVASVTAGASSANCYMTSANTVAGAPVAGINNSDVAYFGDRNGVVYVFDWSSCTQLAALDTGNIKIVDGPLVFPGPTQGNAASDEVYVLTGDASGSRLVHAEYTEKRSRNTLNPAGSLGLARANAVGMALHDGSLPSNVAVTFAGAMVQTVAISSGFGMSSVATNQLTGTMTESATWCCGSNPSTLAAVNHGGTLTLLDTGLNAVATLVVPAQVNARPVADGAGDWFVAATDGNVYEFPAISLSPTPPLVFGSGQLGSLVTGGLTSCNNGLWLCGFAVGSTGAFEGDLDARAVVISACVSTAPPTCSGDNPRLWARMQVGSRGSTTTVRVQGWSYYSP